MHIYNAKVNLGSIDYTITALDEMSARRLSDAEDDIFRLLVKNDVEAARATEDPHDHIDIKEDQYVRSSYIKESDYVKKNEA